MSPLLNLMHDTANPIHFTKWAALDIEKELEKDVPDFERIKKDLEKIIRKADILTEVLDTYYNDIKKEENDRK